MIRYSHELMSFLYVILPDLWRMMEYSYSCSHRYFKADRCSLSQIAVAITPFQNDLLSTTAQQWMWVSNVVSTLNWNWKWAEFHSSACEKDCAQRFHVVLRPLEGLWHRKWPACPNYWRLTVLRPSGGLCQNCLPSSWSCGQHSKGSEFWKCIYLQRKNATLSSGQM